ncbi:MAG: oligosaccharide flippase family protein [Marinobacter sp.]|uniref:lipopolysaccharide biosynthesis protein n=1 Tax=Marinobacter sp. TaxID=50741 RepID=UPI00299E4407|nr:oligosaccharide flippase family protein [Marinobacter sp.]MDX1754890.1 oligosaccharide flippase family protein [Marinobacter sp.]
MTTASELLKGSVTRVSQTFTSILVAFFMMPFLVHELGDHWYGVWTVIGSLAAAYHLFDLGMASAVTRYVSHAFSLDDSTEANATINTALFIYIAISCGIVFITIAISFVSRLFIDSPDDKTLVQQLVLIVGLSISFELPFNALAGVPNAKLKFHQVALARIFATLLGAALTWYFISKGYGVLALAVITFCTARVSSILYFIICKAAFPQLRLSFRFFSKSKSKELFGYSAWSFIMAISYQLRNNVDNFVIAAFLSASSVTHYAIGLRLVDYLAQFLNQATNMFLPIFTSYHAQDNRELLHQKLLFITRINLLLAMIASGGLIIFGSAFIDRWMGPDFQDAYWVMVVLVIGRMIDIVNTPLKSAMLAASKHNIVAKADIVDVTLNVPLSIILVHYYGILGVAMGTLIPMVALHLIVLPIYGCRSIELPVFTFYRSMLRPMVAVIPIIGLTFYSMTTVAPETYTDILVFGSVMALLCVVSGVIFGFSNQEKSDLQKLIPRRLINLIPSNR